MNESPQGAANPALMPAQARAGFVVLLFFHIVVCCISLVYVAEQYTAYNIVWFDPARLYAAVPAVAVIGLVSLLFVFCRFSFGFLVGFSFYTMIVGYLWIAEFSQFAYNHPLANFSAFASALAFLLPALLITAPIEQRFVLTARALDHVLSGILILAVATIACGAFYNFRLVGITEIYEFRSQLEFPTWLRYAIGVTSNVLLPFAFACFVAGKHSARAAVVLLLLLLFYPITLSKLALFAPFWLLFMVLLFRFFEVRTSVVLSLFVPMLIGIALHVLMKYGGFSNGAFRTYFATINMRMVGFPSIAIDVYNDFFSSHSFTYFCQINLLKPLVDCPYTEPLSIVMEQAYQVGNLNASLFATEGIASVGTLFAPVPVFACGLIIALANRLSAGLPPRFTMISGAMLPQVMLNVPLTITLASYGAAALFLLWYVTPRTIFDRRNERDAAAH